MTTNERTKKKNREAGPAKALALARPVTEEEDELPAELVTQITDYPLFASPGKMREVLKLIDENLGHQSFTVLDLPHIKVPAGGGPEFRVDDPSGCHSMREVTGVITAFRQARIYWKKAYGAGGGKKPPSCTSTDGLKGEGDPGGYCAECPLAKFGTALNLDGTPGAGQACKEVRQLLIVLPGQILPHILNIPPTSLKNWKHYSLGLVASQVHFWAVETTLRLEAGTSTGGIEYSRIRFSLERPLSAQQRATHAPYHDRMDQLLKPAIVDGAAYEVIDESHENEEQAPEDTPF